MINSTPAIETDNAGTLRWLLDGKLHRTNGPAIEHADGGREWRSHGKLHRTDGPAIEDADGTKEWWAHGERHRIDGPAVEQSNGSKHWWVDGKLHRPDGPALEWANGHKEWWANGEHHRADGPAVEYANGKEWFLNGEHHRADGPAIEHADGRKEWHFNGQEIPKPYTYMLTAAFARGLPIPPDVFEAIPQTQGPQNGQLDQLNSILYKYWPTDVQRILATLLSDSDPAIKHLAFSLLGRQAKAGRNHGTVHL